MGVVASFLVKILGQTSDFEKSVKGLDEQLGGLNLTAQGLATGFKVFTAAATTLGIGKMVDEFLDLSGKLSDINAKTGISVIELQRLEYAGSLVGLSLDDVSGAASMLQKRIGAGNAGAVGAIAELGLNFDLLSQQDPGLQFSIVARELGKVTDQSHLAALATELFGRSGTTLIPLFKSNLQELGDEAERLGLILSKEGVKGGDDLGDALTKAKHLGMVLIENALQPVLEVMHHIQEAGGPERWAYAFHVEGVLAKWRELAGLMDIVLHGEGEAPKVPGAPGLFGAGVGGLRQPRAGEISGRPLSLQDANRVEADLARQMKKQDDAIKAQQEKAKQLAEAWQEVNDKMSGKAAITAAQTWIQHLTEVRKVAQDSPEEMKRGFTVIGEALAAMARRGETATKSMIDLYLVTMKFADLGPKMTSGLQNLVDVTGKLMVGTQVGFPFSPAMIPNLGVTSGLGGLNLPGEFGPVGPIPKADSIFKQIFGSPQAFGAEMSQTIMAAITGGGDVLKAAFGKLGSDVGKHFSESIAAAMAKTTGFFTSGLGKLFGGALSSILPGLGALLGPLISKFGGFFSKLFGKGDDADKERDAFTKLQGGFDTLAAKLHEVGTEGDKMFAALQGAKNGAQAKAAIDNITAALEKQKQAIDNAMSALPSGVNARSQNISSQADFSVVGAEAIGTFAFLIQQGQSAIQAFTAITPAVQAMSAAFATGNFEMTGAAEQLMNLNNIVTANKVQFDNLSASGTILTAMLQANIQNGQLFAAVASDIGTQVQAVIDRGVPMEQVFALAQPQLQALWEAQNKWHFELDATTQSLLDQAAAQGFVGEAMKGVQQQILDVLTRIAEFMGALPAQAQTAAAGMNAAFGGLRAPDLGGIMSHEQAADLFTKAQAQMGGPNVAEPYVAGGGGQAVQLNVDGRALAEVMVPRITEEVNRIVG